MGGWTKKKIKISQRTIALFISFFASWYAWNVYDLRFEATHSIIFSFVDKSKFSQKVILKIYAAQHLKVYS